MHTTTALIADKAVQYPDGKFDLIGVHSRRVEAKYPTDIDLVVFLEFNITDADLDSDNVLTVHILHSDGSELAKVSSGSLSFLNDPDPDLVPRYYTKPLALRVRFPGPDRYVFEIRHNGVRWAAISYNVVKA